MANRNKTDEPVKYMVLAQPQDFVIEVPANWKLTFGAVNPGGAGMGGRHDLHCLRVWEGEKLRAVFCDVRGIRDMSIPLARKVTRETGSASWTMDSEGGFSRSEERAVAVDFHLESGDAVEFPDAPEF